MKVSAPIVFIRSKKNYQKQFYSRIIINALWIIFALLMVYVVLVDASNAIGTIMIILSPIPIAELLYFFIERRKYQKKYYEEIGELMLDNIDASLTIALHNKGVKKYSLHELNNLEVKISNYAQEEYEGTASTFENGIENYISFIYEDKKHVYRFQIGDYEAFQNFLDIRNSLILTIYKDLG